MIKAEEYKTYGTVGTGSDIQIKLKANIDACLIKALIFNLYISAINVY